MATRPTIRKAAESDRELESVPLKLAARTLGELANEAGYGNLIRPLTRRGKTIAALIGMKDLDRLRKLDTSAA